MKNDKRKGEAVNLDTVVDETEEIRSFIKQKDLQNQVLKRIIEKMQEKKINPGHSMT